MKILHLINTLDGADATRQLQLLGPALTEHHAVEICCLGRDTPSTTALRRAGLIVHALGWTRWFDPAALLGVRDVVRESAADVIHVWDLPSLRSLAVSAWDALPRVVMSGAPEQGACWLDRKLLNRVRRQNFPGIIAPLTRAEKSPDTFCRIACVGGNGRADGLRQAIWAFDILLVLYPDAQLRLGGAGDQREELQMLIDGLRNVANVQFDDTSTVLADADIVWVPSLANRGRQIALEVMALGKPVIASDVPCLRELIADGATGYLTPPGDVIALARRTHALLRDESLRESIGAAARDHVANRFSVAQALEQWRDVYRTVAA